MLTNYSGSWHYRYTVPAGGQCSEIQTEPTASVTGLNPNITYTFQAYSDITCSTGLATAANFTTPEKSLTWSGIAATAVRLTIAGHTGNWYYQANRPPHTTCTGPESADTVVLENLSMNTTYTYTAYSDNSCSTEIAATESFKTLNPALAASAVTATTATLTLSGWVPGTGTGQDGAWYYKHGNPGATCSGAQSATTASLTGLTTNTRYTYTAYSDSTCTSANELAAAKPFTTLNPALTAVQSGGNNVTLTLTNWANADGDWYYQDDQNQSCSSAVGAPTGTNTTSTHVAVSVLADTSTTYVFTAYRDSGCSTVIAAAPSLTPVVTFEASEVGATYVTLILGLYPDDWYVKADKAPHNNCSNVVPAGNTDVRLNDLSLNTKYTYTAYSDNTCSTKIVAAKSFTTLTPTLASSDQIATTATLTISDWDVDSNKDGNWYFKADKAPHTTCSAAQSATTADLTGLTMDTSYTYTAHSDSTCTSANEIARLTFKTADPALTASNVGSTTATLTISGWAPSTDGDWYYKHGNTGATCSTSAVTTDSVNLADLTKNTSYTFTAYSDSGCTTAIVAASQFTTLDASLAVSNNTTTGATLTISGYSGAWWYQADTGPDTICTSAAGATSVNLTGLTQGNSYTYTAYNASTCPYEIASVTVATLSLAASPGAFAMKLTLNGRTGDWYYKHGNSGATCSTSAVTTPSVTVSGLTKNTSYTFTAYSDSGCTTTIIAASAVTTLNPSLTARKGDNNPKFGITLILSGYSIAIDGPWWFRELKTAGDPALDRCSSGGSSLRHDTWGLTKNSTYTVSAHTATNCTAASKIAEVTGVRTDN